VRGTWEEEYKRTGGKDGLVRNVKALVSMELRMGIDGYKVAVQYLQRGKEQAGKKADEVKQ
jgi:hypothetical protein